MAEVQQPAEAALRGERGVPPADVQQPAGRTPLHRLTERDDEREAGRGPVGDRGPAGRQQRHERAGPAVRERVPDAVGGAEHVDPDPVDARSAGDAEVLAAHRDPVARGLARRQVRDLVVEPLGGTALADLRVGLAGGRIGQLGRLVIGSGEVTR